METIKKPPSLNMLEGSLIFGPEGRTRTDTSSLTADFESAASTNFTTSGPEENKSAWICLHGPSSWSFVFQSFLNSMPESERVILVDMIGFGKSDKPKREKFHQLQKHRLILGDFVDRLGLKSINVVLEGWHSGLLMSLCEGISPLICSFLLLPEGLSRSSVGEFEDAMQAPFPDKGYKAGVRESSRLLLELKKRKKFRFLKYLIIFRYYYLMCAAFAMLVHFNRCLGAGVFPGCDVPIK